MQKVARLLHWGKGGGGLTATTGGCFFGGGGSIQAARTIAEAIVRLKVSCCADLSLEECLVQQPTANSTTRLMCRGKPNAKIKQKQQTTAFYILYKECVLFFLSLHNANLNCIQ